jgi:hypothetical protein
MPVSGPAAEQGLLPNQLQSVTWEAAKGLFSPAQRRDPALKAAVDNIWQQLSRRKIGRQDVHEQLYDLATKGRQGQLIPPEWAAYPPK